MLTRICSICGRKVIVGEQCICVKQRQKEYDRDNRNKDSQAFYHSRQWQLLQRAAASRANFADEYILHYENRMVQGRIVHHIIPVSERPDLRLNPKNLIYVSDKTHRMIHEQYDKGEQAKKIMQEKLFAIRKNI